MTIDKSDPAIRAFGAEIMLKQFQAMRMEGPGVLQGGDIEYIHRMRVASRRLRAAQQIFDSYLFKRRVDDWEKAVRRVTRSLGLARDLDIQLETIQRFRLTVMDPRCSVGAGRLYLRLLQARAAAQKEVVRSVQKFSMDSVLEFAEPRMQKARAVYPAEITPSSDLFALADESIRRKIDAFIAYDPYVEQPEKMAELHAMRIAGKQLRYTIEIFDPIYPDGLKQWLKPLKEIQDYLGQIHDCDVWAAFLPGFIEDERQLTRDFFGHLRGFRRILPGLEVFRLNRAGERERLYREFVDAWLTLKEKYLWDKLRELTISSVPIYSKGMEPPQPVSISLDDEDEMEPTPVPEHTTKAKK
jgi:CHAD domain-containing protein